MKAIYYSNTKTTLPGWREPLHTIQPLGFAYETDSHFVHFYGKADGLYIISPGLTVIEQKTGSLEDWVKKTFGASGILDMKNEVGHTIEGIWRPGLYFPNEMLSGMNFSQNEHRSSEQALRILIERLDELLLYIEPDGPGLDSFGHKTRELLILASTEVENQWTALLRKSSAYHSTTRNLTTQDYVKLLYPAFLSEYQVKLRNYDAVGSVTPFEKWDSSSPTQSLSWYDSYNKTKHDRTSHFSRATLRNAIEAVTADLVLFCVRFSPIQLLNETKTLSSIVHQTFEITLAKADPGSFYIPLIELPPDTRQGLLVYDSYREQHNKPWIVDDLAL